MRAGLLQPPGEFADPPALADATLGLEAAGHPHDLLSELLRSVRLNGERIVAYAPPRAFSVGFAGIGSLHIIEAGEVLLRIDGDPHVERVSRGDVILLPRGDRHQLSDAGHRTEAAVSVGTAESDAPEPARWLCGTFTIGDPHASHLRHDWTVSELARACNLSRSAFAARFAARVGKPPAAYLAHVRLDAATDLLRGTSLPVTLIAEKVGYMSEAAFSRAFRSRYGTPPARWRRDMRAKHS